MDIAGLRKQIDEIDAELLALLDKRTRLAMDIAQAKLEQNLPLHDPQREAAMLQSAIDGSFETLAPQEAEEFVAALLPLTRRWVVRRRRAAHVTPQRIAIIGLGLIGGSLAKALKRATPAHTLTGVDLADHLQGPRDSGLFAELFTPDEGGKAVTNADVVFLCTHFEKTIELLPALADDTPVEATVTDVSGIKEPVAKAAEEAFKSPSAPHFVGGHPMAGKAASGFENSDPELFEGRPWVLTPTPHDPVDKMRRLSILIESVGAHVELLSPSEHDRTMAVVSHLPQLMSVALMLTAGGRDADVAGPALREMTRLAASPASLWNRLVGRLRKEVIGELQRAQSYLTELEMAINFEEPLDKWFDRANKLRAELEADEQKRNEG
ncbi:MAG: bifunctional chorismate mutase/prephenate dehydrogenase [Planctomycetes bacterium]|nr:bifunctional chorismate mutase/prephenate dehydrogenase [Planctomycetota bacterium]